MSSQEDKKDRKEYLNIDGMGNRPIFEIFEKGEPNPETLTGDSRINLAISLTKFRLHHLFNKENIKLKGEIYHKEIFEVFLKFACNGIEEKSEELKKYSLYLYVYSDIWGFDDLKEAINKLWKNNPDIIYISKENEKNKDFLNDIISYQERIFRNTSQDPDLSYISPIEFYAKNINIILSESIKTSKFADFPPDYLDIIFQHIYEKSEKLDSKIYFNFLLQYIQRACDEKRKSDLLLCSNLIRYLKLDELNYDDLKKYVKMDFIQKIGSENKQKNTNEEEQKVEKQKTEKNEKESEYGKEVEEKEEERKEEEKGKEEEKRKEEEEGTEEEEEEEEIDNYEVYFDFLTFTQFKSFAQKLIDENEKTKGEIEELKKKIDTLFKKYNEKDAEIQSLMNNKQEELIEEAKKQLTPLTESLNDIKKQVEDIKEKNINLDEIQKNVEQNASDYGKLDKKFSSIERNVDELNYQYQISSYVISAINHQFYSIDNQKQSIYKIEKDQEGILCQAELNFNQIQYENIDIKNIFKFSLIKDDNNNPTVYFCSNSLLKSAQTQSDVNNKNNIFYDIMIKKYEIEIENTEFQRVISWELEGFFPRDLNSYIKFKDNIQDAPEDQWFPISVHNIADASEKKSPFDTLLINDNYTEYTCTLGFSPICKFIRLKLIRNSNDDNVLRIKSLKLYGHVLQPFYPEIQKA